MLENNAFFGKHCFFKQCFYTTSLMKYKKKFVTQSLIEVTVL